MEAIEEKLLGMALQKRELLIALKPEEWKQYKLLGDKQSGKCFKDPSEVFRLGLKSACNVHMN